MSREKGRRAPPGWSSPSPYGSGGHGPTVVNATFDLSTNNFTVSEDSYSYVPRQPPTRSKFDFGRPQIDQSMEWAMDAQRGWEAAANVDNGDAWVQSARYEPKSEARFSTKSHQVDDDEQPATFHLNLDIPDQPYFSQSVEYDSFRDRSVIPTADDIFNDEREVMEEAYQNPNERRKLRPIPGIPINRVKGPYDSVEQYLYTHYELLRQDCLIPLQKAVKSYREMVAKAKNNDLSTVTAADDQPPLTRDFRLYEHVRLNAVVFGSRQVLYRIAFRVPYYAKVSWPQSKRLIEGTLVLLSKDNFEKDLKIATVVMRGEEPMKGSSRFEHMIDIHLERDNENMPLGFGDPSLSEEDTYVMLEATDGYFEAYRHILSVFQTIPSDDLPFSEYLVDVSRNVRLPHYAAVKRHYDIAMYPIGKRRTGDKAKPVDITQIWPKYQIGMDSTQMDALKTILSNNVAIVQGPPGTGKTFVGTYAMRVLLNNFPHSIGPIVCICQTNHALDQFLEHILNHEDKIVRIGSRSKSELLKDRLLYELRKDQERRPGFGRLMSQRRGVEKAITEMLREMYEEPCVDLEFLRKIKALNPRQLDSLKRLGEREEKRAKTTAATSAFDDDDDDDWVTSSTPDTRTPPPPPSSRSRRGKHQNNSKSNNSSQNEWATGNTNYAPEEAEKKINPVEIWLQDAIEYVDGSSPMYNFTEEMKEDLLEQNRGLVFEDENDEEDIADEEELREITLNFAEEPDLRGNKAPFINIGRAYKKQSREGPRLETMYNRYVEGNRGVKDTERKVINYKKILAAKTFNTEDFNFFEDVIDESALEPQHYVLERWMKEEDDVTLWPLPVRLKAHKKWAELRNKEYTEKLKSLIERYENVCKDIRRFNMLSDARICRENRVIGMTSTAAAKYHDLLEEIRPRIMVVEEAAEMMEAHIVSAVTKSLQHLILIGDHQQLRPQNAVHALAEKHFLNVSLFERLVMNEIPFTRLSHQRRMRPEIRMFIDPIYSDPPLQDHDEVKDPTKRPPVRGVDQSVFFLSHNEPESHVPETASKCNEHEAAMAAKLSRYLLLQGYSPEDITIITMYSGQRTMIKRQLRQERTALLDTSLIQVSSVDGYQGEENKIIILSLVRSNAQGQIGFLKVANRVCVSLSRAKEGMYILGNASLLCERSDLWNEIICNLEDNARERIGTRLKLRCKKHNQVTEVQWPVDFATIPEGGCTRECGEMLACGHRCNLLCHAYDHEETRCEQPCERIFPECKHPCPRRCFESCGTCIKTIKLLLPCGHEIEGECGKLRIARHCPVCLKR